MTTLLRSLVLLLGVLFASLVYAEVSTVLNIDVAHMRTVAEMNGGEPRGMVIDVLELMKPKLEEFTGSPIEYRFNRSTLVNGLDHVQSGHADTIAGGISSTADRMEADLEFSQPWLTSGLRMLVHRKAEPHLWNVFGDLLSKPLFWEGFLMVMLAFFPLPAIIYVIEHRHNPQRFNKFWKDTAKITRYLLGLVITSLGRGVESPKSPINDWLVNLVILFGGLGVAVSVTVLATVIMDPSADAVVETPYDLRGKHVIVKEGSRAHVAVVSFGPKRVQLVGEAEEAYLELMQNPNAIVVHDAPELESFATTHNALSVVGRQFDEQLYAFPFAKGSAWRAHFDQAILYVRQERRAEFQELCRKWFATACI